MELNKPNELSVHNQAGKEILDHIDGSACARAAAPRSLQALEEILAALEHHQHWKASMPGYLADVARTAIAQDRAIHAAELRITDSPASENETG